MIQSCAGNILNLAATNLLHQLFESIVPMQVLFSVAMRFQA